MLYGYKQMGKDQKSSHMELVILISSNNCSLAVVRFFKSSMVILLIISFGFFHCFSLLFLALASNSLKAWSISASYILCTYTYCIKLRWYNKSYQTISPSQETIPKLHHSSQMKEEWAQCYSTLMVCKIFSGFLSKFFPVPWQIVQG